jgi:hypothetical protein
MAAHAAGTRGGFVFYVVFLGALANLPSALLAQASDESAPLKTLPASPARDLSGVWLEKSGRSSSLLTNTQQEPPLTAWGKTQFKAARSTEPKKQNGGANISDPHAYCDPVGMPRADLTKRPIEIVQTGDEVYIFYEQDHSWRQIYMDGRALPDGPDPSYLGYSVGKWDGDTLVVDTIGLNDKTWLDDAGHPHSDALHLVERIQRTGADTLQVTLSIEDTKAYTKAWTSAPRMFELKRGYELAEDYCVAADNLGTRKTASPSASPEK